MNGNGGWPPEKIREKRHEKHLRQIDCANLVTVSRSAWQRWESGETRPSLVSLMKIESILGDGSIELYPWETRKVMNIIIRCGIHIDDLTPDQKRDLIEVIDMLNEKLGSQNESTKTPYKNIL